MAQHSLLKQLSNATGIPGHENKIRQIFLEHVGKLGTLSSDATGCVAIELPAATTTSNTSPLPRIMLTAHMDEVGFLVQAILADGSIQLLPLGGWWSHTLLSQRMQITTRQGKEILALIAATPPHLLAADSNKVLPVEKLLLDVGTSSAEETKALGIAVGDPVCPLSNYEALAQPNRYIGKALDNRLGLGCLIECTQELATNPAPNHTFATATVQEEVGTRGATTAAALVKPDVAIVLECAPADDLPQQSPHATQGKLGSGVQIRLVDPGAIANRPLVDLALSIAEQHNIAHQVAVRRSGGTDAKAIHLAEQGIPTLVLGVPARHIHSHNAIYDQRDYDAMQKLSTLLVQQLNQETVSKITNCRFW